MPLTFRSLLATVGAVLLTPIIALAQPANDACANAIVLTVTNGATTSVTGSTATATLDGTATCGSSTTSKDVWYRFTTPALGDYTVDTCGTTNYDSVVSVRTISCTSGSEIICDDDACGSLRSRVTLTGRPAGEQLLIRVSGYNGASGSFSLNVTHVIPQPPANDLCSAVQVVSLATDSSTTISNASTVLSGNEGAASCNAGAVNDVWYRVTMPSAGNFTVSTCGSSFNTVVSVRTACPGSGSELGCNDDVSGCASNGSRVTLTGLPSGQILFIRVAGVAGATGGFGITFSHGLTSNPPNPTIGPDVVTNVIVDVAHWGTDGAGTSAFSVGTDSCNPGDYPVLWIDSSSYLPDYDTTQHPVISQNVYRLKSYGAFSRFEHLGQSWLKHGFLSVNGGACGTCGSKSVWRPSTQSYQNIGSDALGITCSDTYGSGLNGSQGGLGAKNIVNATTGTSPFIKGNGTGDATTRARCQVPTVDVTAQPGGTRFYVDAFYVTADDAQFVRPGETVAINALNNASWRELNTAWTGLGGASSTQFTGNTIQQQPGIFAWKAADASVTLVTADHDDTPNPGTGFRDANGNPSFPGTFIRSRFWAAAKVTSLGGGQWRYEYAVYNHNSDRSAQSFQILLPNGVNATSTFFHAPSWHSGEPYSNAAWTSSKVNDVLTFTTQDFATDPNANALRWGCLYNFGFTAPVAPITDIGGLRLFKPGTLNGVALRGLPVPNAGRCAIDIDDGLSYGMPDGVVDINDLLFFLDSFESGSIAADLDDDGDPAVGVPDATTDINDLLFFLARFEQGC